jgi:hypothetical protein
MPEDEEREPETETVDPSHDLDMVVLFRSSRHDGEMEATAVNSMLQSNGIPSMVVGATQIPSLEFQVRVPRENLEEAERVLAEARAAGPEAADEAEQNSEGAV